MSDPTTPRLVDLSHEVAAGVITYPGLPTPVIEDHLSWDASHDHYDDGTEFRIGRIEMVANTGTYLDTPAHRYRNGFDLAGLPLASVAAVPGVVVEAVGVRAVDVDAVVDLDVAGRAVLVRTGWDRHWTTPAYGVDHPYLTGAAADHLVASGATLVGIDSVNIDDTSDGRGDRPAHTGLLGAGIPVLEHLCGLDQLGPATFRLFAVPVKVQGMGTFPVRAFAMLESDGGG